MKFVFAYFWTGILQEICCSSRPYLMVSTEVQISASVSALWEVQSNKVDTGKTNSSCALCCWPACKSLSVGLFLVQKEVRLTAHICSWSELTWATNNLGQGGYSAIPYRKWTCFFTENVFEIMEHDTSTLFNGSTYNILVFQQQAATIKLKWWFGFVVYVFKLASVRAIFPSTLHV